MEQRADLHMHTTASDGTMRPAEVVALAHKAGLALIAITDHDTTAGVDEATVAGASLGITVCPGVEISTALSGQEIHILGYGIDPANELLQQRLAEQRDVRNVRNMAMLRVLLNLGFAVPMSDVEAVAASDRRKEGTIGRPHIAQAMVNKGYVSNIREAFDLWLGEGRPAYVQAERITSFEAVQWIHEAGGLAVVAHPGLYGRDDLVAQILEAGADGLEAYHSDHTAGDEHKYEAWAGQIGKLATGGSDFHGFQEDGAYHGELGSKTVNAQLLPALIRQIK